MKSAMIEAAAKIRQILLSHREDDRTEILYLVGVCRHCGIDLICESKKTGRIVTYCYCMNDE